MEFCRGKQGTTTPMGLVPPLILLLFICQQLAYAQGLTDYRERVAREVFPGLRRSVYTFPTNMGMSEIQAIEVQLAHPQLLMELALPVQGVFRAMPVEDVALAMNAEAIMGLDQQPASTDPALLKGLRFFSGRLHSWPATGNHLVITPEGSASFQQLPALTAGLATFDEGTTATIVSLNGKLPSLNNEIAVYTGALDQKDLVVLGWSSNVRVYTLQPLTADVDPLLQLVSSYKGERRFRPVNVADRTTLRLLNGELAIITTETPEVRLLSALEQRGPVQLDFPLPDLVHLSRMVAPVGAMLMENGELSDLTRREAIARNVLALDETGNRMIAISASDLQRRGRGVSHEQLVDYLRKEGYIHAALLDDRAPMLLPDVVRRSEYRDPSITSVRMALSFRKGRPTMGLPDRELDLFRQQLVTVEGTLTEFLINQPKSLMDEKTGLTPGLESYWAIPVNKGEPAPSVRFRFAKATRIAAVDLLHAENVGFSAEFNLKSYRILGRRNSQVLWTELASKSHDSPVARERVYFEGAPQIQELKLEILDPNFIPEANVARLVEVIFWGPDDPEFTKR